MRSQICLIGGQCVDIEIRMRLWVILEVFVTVVAAHQHHAVFGTLGLATAGAI